MKKSSVITVFFFFVLVTFFNIISATAMEIDRELYAELVQKGAEKQILTRYGVPGVMMPLPMGQSLSSLCRDIKRFAGDSYYHYRGTISLFNRLECHAVRGDKSDLSTNVGLIFIPLNYSIWPKIIPFFLSDLAGHEKFILIDVGLQCLGLYEKGRLIHIFPISSGKNGTPTRSFIVLDKEKNHYSSLYGNAWMPFSLRLFGNYFLHGGILPGYPASHGCVRADLYEMKVIFDWARVGIPGKIVRTGI